MLHVCPPLTADSFVTTVIFMWTFEQTAFMNRAHRQVRGKTSDYYLDEQGLEVAIEQGYGYERADAS